ncbi:MAG: GIY-YIG nuclease family protein [Spirochaetia bacterium]|nr:GIY-YIG nuclease family protein [Spirochaetia bacterium]
MPYMYILECADGTYYTGSTYNLSKRVEEHNQGEGANYTSKRLPVKLIYSEEFNGIEEAFKREKQIQNWNHAKKKALLEKDYEELKKYVMKKPAIFDGNLFYIFIQLTV